MRLVKRSQWGARRPTSVTPLSAEHVDTVFFHYTSANADEQSDHANCGSRVKAVQRYHMTANPSDPTKPWADIAYSFLVCKHGYVFEGRGYGVRSAATGLDNSHSLAVCFLGDDTKNRDDLTIGGRGALVEITAAIEKWAGKRLAYRGHRDAMNTRCPGDEIYNYIHGAGFAKAVRQQDEPAWYTKALTLEPLWAWMLWRDNGQPAEWRPPQIPKKVPAWWWPRYVLHKGGV